MVGNCTTPVQAKLQFTGKKEIVILHPMKAQTQEISSTTRLMILSFRYVTSQLPWMYFAYFLIVFIAMS